MIISCPDAQCPKQGKMEASEVSAGTLSSSGMLLFYFFRISYISLHVGIYENTLSVIISLYTAV